MERKSLLEIFATHPVAMNVLMLVVLALGIGAFQRINFQFFPSFTVPAISVDTTWQSASAEDVERSITNRLELDLKNMDNLKQITSTSRSARSRIVLEFEDGANISDALDDAKQIVTLAASSLPEEAELPEVVLIEQYEVVAKVIVTASHPDQLRGLVNDYRDELLAAGIGKVDISGLPEEEISIQIPSERLREIQMNLNQVGQRIRASSIDAPVGLLGRNDAARQLRFIEQRRSEREFENITVLADDDGSLVKLGDIAEIQRRAKSDQVTVAFQGKPAAILTLKRLQSANTLENADILYAWFDSKKPTLPPSVDIFIHDDRSVSLRGRLSVLVKNGLVGLLLVLTVLFVFLNFRLAFWVAAGIPVSIFGALGLLYMVGGSLNMVTMFALIMTLGIIVDDAIVVGEDALHRFNHGDLAAQAVQRAARMMFLPILAASATTIFAFLPVTIVPGPIGQIMASLGIVVVCVVAISLVEAFLILPGHLNHSFKKLRGKAPSRFSQAVDRSFSRFRDGPFRSLVSLCIHRPVLAISVCLAIVILTVGLVASGRLGYTFFPTPELDRIFANASFVAGTPSDKIDDYLAQVEKALLETESELGDGLISSHYVQHGVVVQVDDTDALGSQHGSVVVELVPSDSRDVRTAQFMRTWEQKLEDAPGLENLILFLPSAGPAGADIEINLIGDDRHRVKRAAEELTQYLKTLAGVYGVKDDTSYGYQQRVMTLTPRGESLGLNTKEISRQLSPAIEGQTLQSFTSRSEEIDVVPKLPDSETNFLGNMENIWIQLPSGQSIPLLDVVRFDQQRGFDVLLRKDGRFTIAVTGDVDPTRNNVREVLSELESNIVPNLVKKHGVDWTYGRSTRDQTAVEESMKFGGAIALLLIYLTLTWAFGSYVWPIFVMAAIPFGIVGAMWGHYALGFQLSIVSIFGIIGLSGIVVNNSIVLVIRYKQNMEQAMMDSKSAMIEASCRRFRPVLLASITTIAGLLPLLFEDSTQAEFLKPMVAAISFGLGFSTVLVLFFVPALLSSFETLRMRMKRKIPSTDQYSGPDDALPSAQ